MVLDYRVVLLYNRSPSIGVVLDYIVVHSSLHWRAHLFCGISQVDGIREEVSPFVGAS